MAIQPLRLMGDPCLLGIAQPVEESAFGSSALFELVRDLWDTMHAANGAGLAAPQIGQALQVVVFGSGQVNPRYPDAPVIAPTVLCNPVITPLDSNGLTTEQAPLQEGWEGCLSVPGLRGKVSRYRYIRYTGRTPEGELIDQVVSDFHARVVQHECDHLWGTLYPMRLTDLRDFGYTEVLFQELP
jgi:peptide deformylase